MNKSVKLSGCLIFIIGLITLTNSSALAQLDATVDSHTIPATMAPGEVKEISITMENSGATTPWTYAEHSLQSINDPYNLWVKWLNLLNPGETIDPGATKTFTFFITAPDTPGTYNCNWQMHSNVDGFFGEMLETEVLVSESTIPAMDARVISHTIPTCLAPGEEREVSVTMENSGASISWEYAYHSLQSQNDPNNFWLKWLNLLDPGETVDPGATRTFTFTITAPDTPGNYICNWQMHISKSFGSLFFGELLETTVAVGESQTCEYDQCNTGTCTDISGELECLSPLNKADGTVCNDGLFCNGDDTCLGGICSEHSGDPCILPTPLCDEDNDTCSGCSVDNDCGLCEKCDTGQCIPQLNSEDLKGECPDGDCVTGLCDGAGACGYASGGTPCGDPSDTDCTDPDTCDGTGICLDNHTASGTSCGDLSDTDCTDPDTCDGTGTCLDNDTTSGTSCGNTSDSDCTDPDTCDGTGICLDNHTALGTSCGDTSDSDCTDPDTCDGGGICLNNHTPAGTACADGNACTENDTCNAGSCQSGSPLICNDSNVCTNDSCNPASGCVYANNTNYCNDNNICTTIDTCSGGSCFGNSPLNCNDGNLCTDDSCNPASGCLYANNSATCNDNNACTTVDTCSGGSCTGSSPPDCNDANLCTDDNCDPASGCIYAFNANPCNDNNLCTTVDTCSGGSCAGSSPLDCDDGNVCTDDSCDATSGCVYANNTTGCDDGINCTASDICAAGLCNGTPNNTLCEDPDSCTYDICTAGEGCSNPVIEYTITLSPDPLSLGNPGDLGVITGLIEEDGIPLDAGYQVTFNEFDFFNAITLYPMALLDDAGETVVTIHGQSLGSGQLMIEAINESGDVITDQCNLTTPLDTCAALSENTLAIVTLPCETAMTVTCEDSGTPVSGFLIAGIDPSSVALLEVTSETDDFGEAKLLVEALTDGQATVIASVNCAAADGETSVVITPCDGDEDCTFLNDQCNDGVCNLLTNTCEPQPVTAGTSCNDNNACTTVDTCSAGSCVGISPPDCNDGNVCTDDICDPASGCVNPNNANPCNDNNICTTVDTCSVGSCAGSSPLNCDDGNVCTDDSCNPASGCVNANNTNPCDDSNACTTVDTCSAGSCIGSSPLDCDDGNVCTDNICNPASGQCTHPNNTSPCDDAIFCNGSDTCFNGTCSSHTGNPCPETECNHCNESADTCFDPPGSACTDDNNLCTDDLCNSTGTCTHSNNNLPCNDFIFCNGDDTCDNGSCSAHSGAPCAQPLICDEGLAACVNPIDSDADGIPDDYDNCPSTPNGPFWGTCFTFTSFSLYSTNSCVNDVDCGQEEDALCDVAQIDLNLNGIGDACECESDFSCDEDVDAEDIVALLTDFGRSPFNNPCTNERSCYGDFDCNGGVDADDVSKFLEDFGRSQYNNPCPACEAGSWCVYP